MRGQAFEVFRLLIAAVVAGAILMVLLGLLQNIITPTTDPQTAAAQLVKKFSAYGGTGSTDYIQFRKGMAIDAAAIAREAYMSEGCVTVEVNNISLPSGSFSCNGDNSVCEYINNVGTKARIKVKCGDPKTLNISSKCDAGIGCKITITR